MKWVTVGIVLLSSCSGKSETRPSPKPADAAPPPIDAAPPIDARPPFAVVETKEPFGASTLIRPHAATCPALEWRREPKTVVVQRCKDQPFADQIPTLRDMVTYMRGVDRAFDEVRIVSSVDYYGWPELGHRYIEYAKTHPWNRQKQSLNAWTVEAGQKADLFPEYAAIFQRKPKLTSAEKCSAGRRTDGDESGKFVKAAGVTTNAMIPLGCSMGVIELER